MRKILFSTNKVKAAILPGTKRAYALLAKYKKINFGSAAILTMLVAPFAVQAMVPALAGVGQLNVQDPAQYIEVVPPEDGSPTKNEEQTEVKANASSKAASSDNSEVDVTVNGQKVPVPKNGTVHKRMHSNGSETIVDVRVDSNSSSETSSSSSTTITVDSQTYSTGTDNDERRGVRRIPRY